MIKQLSQITTKDYYFGQDNLIELISEKRKWTKS